MFVCRRRIQGVCEIIAIFYQYLALSSAYSASCISCIFWLSCKFLYFFRKCLVFPIFFCSLGKLSQCCSVISFTYCRNVHVSLALFRFFELYAVFSFMQSWPRSWNKHFRRHSAAIGDNIEQPVSHDIVPSLGTKDRLPVTGVVSGATVAGLLQCSVGWHSITACTALAISDESGHTTRLHNCHVWRFSPPACQWQPFFIGLVVQCWRALEAMGEV